MKLEGQFQIATPCHENWEQMTPETQGRFCDACKKCVVDFTQMSKVEIKNVYDQEQGDVCGRMNISQLQVKRRPAIRASLGRIGKRLRAIQAFALALLLVIGLQTMTEAKAQNDYPVKMGKIAYVPTKASVKGTVSWDNGAKAEGQTVEIYQGKELVHTATTNSAGIFSFPSLKPGDYTLKVRPIHGLVTEQKVHLKDRDIKTVTLILEDRILMGDTIYVPDEGSKLEEIIEIQEDAAQEEPLKLPILDENPFDDQPESLENDISTIAPIGEKSVNTILIAPPAEKMTETPSNATKEADQALQLHIFPNPSDGLLNFTYQSKTKSPLELTVIDIDGKEMLNQKWEESTAHAHQIQMQSWSAGTYYLIFRVGTKTFHEKVLKF